jgi:tetraacyldisaccharide 4'-kinase
MRPPEFWSRHDSGARIIGAIASPIGHVYGATIAWKYRRQSPYRSRAAVICVGNLTVGGTGKTPLVIAIAELLIARGARVACLSRGYGRKQSGARRVDIDADDTRTVGDEALLLARSAPTIVGRDRGDGARLAEALGANAIVMDDGHQNFSLAKDISLVVVDGEAAFGNGHIVPAGPLRESVRQGLARADAVIVMGDGEPPLSDFAGPVLRARLSASRRLDGRRVVAFAGIGQPEKFFAMLRALGAEVAACHSFADHHGYTPGELARLRQRADALEASLTTTEKDFVRLGSNDRHGIAVLPVHAVFDEPAALDRLLAPLLGKASVGA